MKTTPLINMDAELDKKIEHFKRNLKFGNERHIRLVEKIGDLEKLKKQLENKKYEARGVKTLEKKIDELKKKIVQEIDYDNAQ